MPPKNTPRTRVSLDDDWLAAFDEGSQTPAAPAPEPAEPRPAPRRTRPARVETSGDDWLHTLDQSHDVPHRRSNGKAPRPRRSTFAIESKAADEDACDIEPAPVERRCPWLDRFASLRSKFGRPALLGAGGLTMGLAISLVFRPAPTPTPAEPPSVMAPLAQVDPSMRELIVAPTGGEGTVTSLTDAIRAASAGQRIRVKPGTYAGAVVVDKPVEIVGDGKPSEVILTSEGGTGLLVKAETALVRGLTIRVKPGAEKARGVEVRSGRAVLEELEIEAPEAGLVVGGEGTAPIVRRVAVRGTAAQALVVVEKAGGFFEKCQFLTGTTSGISIQGEACPVLSGCEIKAEAGVLVSQRGEATFIDCRLLGGAKPAATVAEGGRLRLLGCEVTGSSAEGVLVGKDGEVFLDGGSVGKNARAGLAVRAGGRLIVHRCKLSGNTGGEIDAEAGSQIISDAPRPQPSTPRPAEAVAPSRPRPASVTNPAPPPVAPIPVPQVQSSNPLPEPPPDFEGYRNIPPQ